MTEAVCCRACGRSGLEPVIDFGRQPVAHRPLEAPDPAEARFPFSLSLCTECGLVQVPNPIPPATLYGSYNFNFSSWKPEPHLEAELDLLCHPVCPRSVCEIGSNDGRFLSLLRERGVEKPVGVEPNPVAGERAQARGLTIIPGFFQGEIVERLRVDQGPFDLVLARQVIEHVLDVRTFLEDARSLLAPDGRLFLDLPDFAPSVSHGDATTLWEEHVSYFTEPSLRRLLARTGFKAGPVQRYDFSGGCLAISAAPADPADPAEPAPAAASELDQLRRFGPRVREYGQRLGRLLASVKRQGRPVLLYGAGVRACAFSNFLGLGPLIDQAIEDQPERQGLFLPGAQCPIQGLASIPTDGPPPLFLLAVNNENEAKVEAKIKARFGTARTVSVCGPRDFRQDLEALERAVGGGEGGRAFH